MLSPEEQRALSRPPAVLEHIPSSYGFRPSIWKEVSLDQWNDAQWQWQNRILDAETLSRIFTLDAGTIEAIEAFRESFSLCISPHYAALIVREANPCGPLWRQAVPSHDELCSRPELLTDPLGESRHAIAPCATRRYPDRALIYTTHECAMRCRHCTRRAKVGLQATPTPQALEQSIRAVCETTGIRDVLLSGGDLFALETERIRALLSPLRECSHIDVIRLCTRMPCTMPQRFNDPGLPQLLREFAPLYVNTQFNAPGEASLESEAAFAVLRECGCILGNQSVLLKGVNDDAVALEALYRWLLKNGCRPYYLFQCDVAQATGHFRTSIQCGLDIMASLRGRLSGMAIPHYVVDLPDGMGKVDLAPNRMTCTNTPGNVIFTNWFGADVNYPDPPMQ